jgi:hypothetical protein
LQSLDATLALHSTVSQEEKPVQSRSHSDALQVTAPQELGPVQLASTVVAFARSVWHEPLPAHASTQWSASHTTSPVQL